MGDPIRFHGRFNDGTRAVSEDVVLQAADDGERVVIRAAERRVLAEWPRRQVRLVERPAGGAPVRLRCGDDDARLTLPADTPRDDLLRLFPSLERRDGHRHGLRIAAFSAAAAGAVVLIVTLLLPQIAAGLAALVPTSVAERIGDKTATQFARLMTHKKGPRPFCETAEGSAVLERLTARLTAGLATPYAIRVRVIPSPINNAAALPGGHILVFQRLLEEIDEPDGFAGVLAHEIGHVVERHPMAAAIKGAGVALLAGVLLGDITGGGTVGAIAQTLAGAAYSRDAELAADETAIRLLNQAGIRGRGLATFLEHVAKMEPSQSLAFSIFSTHPASQQRAERIRRSTTGAGPGLTPEDWQALKRICDGF